MTQLKCVTIGEWSGNKVILPTGAIGPLWWWPPTLARGFIPSTGLIPKNLLRRGGSAAVLYEQPLRLNSPMDSSYFLFLRVFVWGITRWDGRSLLTADCTDTQVYWYLRYPCLSMVICGKKRGLRGVAPYNVR